MAWKLRSNCCQARVSSPSIFLMAAALALKGPGQHPEDPGAGDRSA